MQCTHQSKSAFALSIVLWIVAALLLGVAFIVSVSKNDLQLTKQLHNKLDTRLEAESVLEALKFAIITSDYDSIGLDIHTKLPYKFPKKIILDGRKYAINKEITIALQDASSMLNIIYPDARLLASLATTADERELFYTIRDSILDWKDSDNVVTLNGAEASFYHLKQGKNYGPRNSQSLQSVDELRLINGMDRLSDNAWKKLKQRIYFGDGAVVDLALLDTFYLQKLLKLNFLDAKMLHQYQTTDMPKFMDFIQKNSHYDENSMGFALSFKIKIDIIVKNHATTSILHTFMNFRSLSKDSLSVDKFEIY